MYYKMVCGFYAIQSKYGERIICGIEYDKTAYI